MATPSRYLDRGYRGMSGLFRYPDHGGGMTFFWDGAAINTDGSLVLIEEELSRPVPLHVQGHVARAAYMLARGEPIDKLVWVVDRVELERLWNIVEPWRRALADVQGIASPVCEYRDATGAVLTLSPDFQ